MGLLDKNFNPKEVEDKWYNYWEKNNLFTAKTDSNKPPFSIVIPPPNVTGSLHMGHALNVTIQDILTRWKIMSGFNVLWVPGTDHAGIATQNVVEKELSKQGLDRHKIGRQAFIEKVWEWKAEYGGRIIHQLKKLGCACDWSRERFTLDEGLSRAVREVFVRLFEEGLLYRDNRLINWCPRCHTALSDLEVEYEEIEGKLYFIKYPLTSNTGKNEEDLINIATTRPETMLGDTAVAVHPEDPRYSHLIGKTVELPLTNRKIKIISESSVDPSFGTGALKVTPAHDFNDEIIGRLHKIPFISVITEDGRMSGDAGDRYKGLDRYECRKKIIANLKEEGLFAGEQRHLHAVGHCYRCKTIIEPILSVQWYVKIESLALEAVRLVREGNIRLIPNAWDNNYYSWMKDIKDWCISRQIWWGHQIPVWYCPDCSGNGGGLQGNVIEHIFYEPLRVNNNTISGGTYSHLRKAGLKHEDIIKNSKIIRIPKEVKPLSQRQDIEECPNCKSKDIIRDPDVLDTWFSSALWPFSTLGWPEDTKELKTFYPTSVLVTGFDILFFWVARMIMMGSKFMEREPFKDVYIHALVRDLDGHKMSKSKGNVIDPLVMIERYGTDAFRFSLAAFAAQGRDVRFSEKKVEGYRHFINKIWNASKFILNYREFRSDKSPLNEYAEQLDLPSMWILNRLAITAQGINKELSEYRFNDAASKIYHFIWHEFCDWYIEIVKPVLYKGDDEAKKVIVNCLFFILDNILRMLHPFMPFITEEIWNSIYADKTSIMTSAYPSEFPFYTDAEELMSFFIDAVSGIRHIRGELNINPSLEIIAGIKTLSQKAEIVLRENISAIMKLTKCRDINIGEHVARSEDSAVTIKNNMEIYVPLGGLLDIKSEMARLIKDKRKTESELSFVSKKLSNEDFLKNAPADIIEKEREKFNILAEKSQKTSESIKILKTIKG